MATLVTTDLENLEKLKTRSNRGSESIAISLKQAIQAGLYAFNEKLPPERDLANAFDAARGTVRRALEELEASGLIVRRIGSGTFVSFSGRENESTTDVVEKTSPLQLIDTRISIEPAIARLACVHSVQLDIENLRMILARLEHSEHNLEALAIYDSEFHRTIAKCSHNPLLIDLYRNVDEVLRHAQQGVMQRGILTLANRQKHNQQHRRIYERIERRDGQGAEEAVREHLYTVRQDLLGASSV